MQTKALKDYRNTSLCVPNYTGSKKDPITVKLIFMMLLSLMKSYTQLYK